MKNIQLTSRAEDLQILATVSCFVLAGVAGLCLPAPMTELPFVGPVLSISLGVMVWGVYHVVMPARPSLKWVTAEKFVVSAVWLLLVFAVAFWFHSENAMWEKFEEPLFVLGDI